MTVNKHYQSYFNDQKRIAILYGGAGSGKSYAAAQKLVLRVISERKHRFLVIRKVANTLKHSVYSLIKSVIYGLDLQNEFVFNVSPPEITCKMNGNQIIFLGIDDPERLKSITDITNVWIEEATELTDEDFTQINLRLRGETDNYKQITLSFNPVSALSWIKKRFFDFQDENVSILKSTYKDNSFLDSEYKNELENLSKVDQNFYNIYTLGEWGVLGNLVYSNYVIEEFSNDPNIYSSVYNGLDWGYNDPAALVRVGVRDSELWILRELYVREKDNPELMKAAEEVLTKQDSITADSSEPKSIKEWTKAGWRVRGTQKGKDSVKYGIDFVRRHRIHIHPSCQNFINEIQGYSYQKDKDGNILEEPIDFKNHLMDALRYALEGLAFKREIKAIESPYGVTFGRTF